MTRKQKDRLTPLLTHLYQDARWMGRLKDDPVGLVHQYANPLDIEAVGFLSAALAIGRVTLFRVVIEKILALTCGQPYHYLTIFNAARERSRFNGLYYRFYSGDDLFYLMNVMSLVVKEYGSIGALMQSLYREEEDIGCTLTRFVGTLRALDERGVPRHPFFSSPAGGSACKRLNLYLRWMVRPKDSIDFGLWKEIPPAKLIIPLDTHVVRIARYLGLTRRKSPNWQMAQEITDHLKCFDHVDPLKYDFVLCHLGISGACPVIPDPEKCRPCPLLGACRRGRRLVKWR